MVKKKAVIFDLDGTLVNSIPVHFRRHQKLFKEKYNYYFDREYFEKFCNGSSEEEFYPRLLKAAGYPDKYEEARKLSMTKKYSTNITNIKTFPHIKSTLKKLKQDGFLLAVASSSNDKYVDTILKENGIIDLFDVRVGGDEVKHTKPDPHIFMLARQKLGVKKDECVVVEDAKNGVLAAKNAKIDCLCLLTSEKPEDIPKHATIVPQIKELHETIIRLK